MNTIFCEYPLREYLHFIATYGSENLPSSWGRSDGPIFWAVTDRESEGKGVEREREREMEAEKEGEREREELR